MAAPTPPTQSVFAVDDGHAERIRQALEALDDVTVQDIRDRTFLMHEGGKIEVRLRRPPHTHTA